MRLIATVAAVAALVLGAEAVLPTREAVLRELRAHLLDLAQRNLAPDQSLKIDIFEGKPAG